MRNAKAGSVIKTVLAYSGSVGSTSISCIVANHKTGFKSAAAALLSLGKVLCPDARTSEAQPFCCVGTLGEGSNFCSRCGKPAKTRKVPADIDYIQACVGEVFGDSLSARDTAASANCGWNLHPVHGKSNPFKNPGEVLVVYQYFEELVAALVSGTDLRDYEVSEAFLLGGGKVYWDDAKFEKQQ